MLQTVGTIIVVLGIIATIWGIFQKVKAGRVTDAPLVPTGDAARRGREIAGPKGQISAQGAVLCQQPLIAPVSGTPCLYYQVRCVAEWKAGSKNKSKILDDQKVAAQFAIDDGSGPVWVDARDGGDFEPRQSKVQTKGAGLLGGLTGGDLMFGSYTVSTGALSLGTKYRVEETVMPLVTRAYACGRISDEGAIAAPGWRALLLSNKSRDELLSSATKGAKISLIAGAASLVVGAGLAVVAQFTAKDEPIAPTTTSASLRSRDRKTDETSPTSTLAPAFGTPTSTSVSPRATLPDVTPGASPATKLGASTPARRPSAPTTRPSAPATTTRPSAPTTRTKPSALPPTNKPSARAP